MSQSKFTVKPAISFAVISVLISMATGCGQVSANLNQSSIADASQPAASTPQTVALKSTGYQKSSEATSKLEVKPTPAVFYFNPNKWKQDGAPQAGRTEFTHANGDGYGIVIAERVQLSDAALRKIALENAKEAAPDAQIVHAEKRVVNGREMTQLRMKATVEGIPVEYLGYYFTGKEGTVQVLTYTTQNLMNEYQLDFEDFLNGFVIEG